MTIHEKLSAIQKVRGEYQYNDDMTVEELKKHFMYDKKTGVFTRINRKNSHGSFDKDGYLILKINKRQYKAHRMAWLYVYGEMPKHNIDHINGKKDDNRIGNLRDVHQSVNVANTKREPNPDTGVIGVYLDRTNGLKKKFARKINGKTRRFYTIEDALSFSPYSL